MAISEQELEIYRKTVSVERLKSFSVHNKNIVTLKDLKEYYVANIKISQAFYQILSTIEITLRNAIDITFKNLLGENWLEQEYLNNYILHQQDYNKFKTSYEKIKNKYKNKFTSGKVVAELHFGFWATLCSKKYNDRIWTKKSFFKGVFENYLKSKQQQIHSIAVKLNKIRNFRNRVFHYEPIIRDDYGIKCMYILIKETLDLLLVDKLSIIKHCCEFEKIYNNLNAQFKYKKT